MEQRKVSLATEPNLDINSVSKDRTRMTGIDTTTKKPVEINVVNGNAKEGEVMARIFDTSNPKKPVLIKEIDGKGQTVTSKPSTPKATPRPSGEVKKEYTEASNQADKFYEENVGQHKEGTPAGDKYRDELDKLTSKANQLNKELAEALKAEKEANKPAKKKGKK